MAYQEPTDHGDMAAIFAAVALALTTWALMSIIAAGLQVAAQGG